jgi:hypothetical protein
MIRYPYRLHRNSRGRLPFTPRQMGIGLSVLFLAFVAYRILTPPEETLAAVVSPDGSKTARLRKFYYVSQPSYKIDYREAGKTLWQNLLYLPSYTNVPHQAAVECLEWSPDAATLRFIINGTSIWHYTFTP